MKKLQIDTNPKVKLVFDNYPDSVKNKMQTLRNLIIETANEIDEITTLEETLKWGEPSYITKIGSTLRMDWKQKNPDQYAFYFNCNSNLVGTFRTVYKDLFKFEGNRAMIFKLDEELPVTELKNCIRVCLTYHKVKQLFLLGL